MNRSILSSGVVIVSKNNDQIEYLLLRAYHHWDFPKGMVEDGEVPLQGALREVFEETTITDVNFDWGKIYMETGPYGKGKVARYYIGLTEQRDVDLPISPELGVPEHEEYRWVSYADACKLVTPRVRSVLEWADRVITAT